MLLEEFGFKGSQAAALGVVPRAPEEVLIKEVAGAPALYPNALEPGRAVAAYAVEELEIG